jgi:hypothetical protein
MCFGKDPASLWTIQAFNCQPTRLIEPDPTDPTIVQRQLDRCLLLSEFYEGYGQMGIGVTLGSSSLLQAS